MRLVVGRVADSFGLIPAFVVMGSIVLTATFIFASGATSPRLQSEDQGN